MSVCFNTKDSVMESNYDDLYCIVIDKKKNLYLKVSILICVLHVRENYLYLQRNMDFCLDVIEMN